MPVLPRHTAVDHTDRQKLTWVNRAGAGGG
jgi:hypothetical protein